MNTVLTGSDKKASEAFPAPDSVGVVILPRTDMKPLLVQVDEVLFSGTNRQGTETRGHEVGIYRTRAGSYVLWIRYSSRYPQERETAIAWVRPRAADLLRCLMDYNPVLEMRFIPGTRHAKPSNRRKAMELMQVRWEKLKTAALASLGSDGVGHFIP